MKSSLNQIMLMDPHTCTICILSVYSHRFAVTFINCTQVMIVAYNIVCKRVSHSMDDVWLIEIQVQSTFQAANGMSAIRILKRNMHFYSSHFHIENISVLTMHRIGFQVLPNRDQEICDYNYASKLHFVLHIYVQCSQLSHKRYELNAKKKTNVLRCVDGQGE